MFDYLLSVKKKKIKISIKRKRIESKNLILHHTKENKWNRNSVTDDISLCHSIMSVADVC